MTTVDCRCGSLLLFGVCAVMSRFCVLLCVVALAYRWGCSLFVVVC